MQNHPWNRSGLEVGIMARLELEVEASVLSSHPPRLALAHEASNEDTVSWDCSSGPNPSTVLCISFRASRIAFPMTLFLVPTWNKGALSARNLSKLTLLRPPPFFCLRWLCQLFGKVFAAFCTTITSIRIHIKFSPTICGC